MFYIAVHSFNQVLWFHVRGTGSTWGLRAKAVKQLLRPYAPLHIAISF
jgi:hypothetical protein